MAMRIASLFVSPTPSRVSGRASLTISCSEKSLESIALVDLWNRLKLAMSDLA
jgi:hypothetical protein